MRSDKPGTTLRYSGSDPYFLNEKNGVCPHFRRDARSRFEELGRVGERARLRLSDPEPAVRHLQAEKFKGEAARRRRHRRPDLRPRGARRENQPDAERPRGDGPPGVEEAAEGNLESTVETEQTIREAPRA